MRRLQAHEVNGTTPAEHEFKLAVCDLILRGLHPSPGRIAGLLGRSETLNGRECRWRREVMAAFGVRLKHGPHA